MYIILSKQDVRVMLIYISRVRHNGSFKEQSSLYSSSKSVPADLSKVFVVRSLILRTVQ